MRTIRLVSKVAFVVLTVIAVSTFALGCKHHEKHEHPSGAEHPSKTEHRTESDHPTEAEHPTGAEHPE